MQVVRNKEQNSYRQSRSSNHNPLWVSSSWAQSPGVRPPGKCCGKHDAGAEGVGRVKVFGGQISRFIAFWNLWDFWTSVNLPNWSQSHKDCPGPLLLFTGSARQSLWVKVPSGPANPPPCVQISVSQSRSTLQTHSLLLSVYLPDYLSFVFNISVCINWIGTIQIHFLSFNLFIYLCLSGCLPIIFLHVKIDEHNHRLLLLLSCFSRARLFVTLCTVACQAPLFMGFSRKEYWSGLPYPPPGDLSDPGIEPMTLMPPSLPGEFFTTSTT